MKKFKIRGATLTEYILIVGLVAAAAIIPLTLFGSSIQEFFIGLGRAVQNAGRYLFGF
jgi:Flp pilus assembly pilin Flp